MSCNIYSYAVLAIVSNSYPPLPGRLPTRYSPVRNSSREASSSFSVLLACIRHAASVRPEPGSNSPQKEFQQNTEKAVKSPNLTKRTNHHKPHKSRPVLASKNYYKEKIIASPTRRGTKKGDKKLNTITCQPIHQCSRNTKQYSKRCVFQHLTGTHQPTNHH